MASFGESLRREREMRSVSLEEISATTKINLRFLHALEAEDFAKLPSGFFTRSFLRAYADYLGLDTETILAEYQLVAPPAVEGFSNLNKASLPQARQGSLGRFVPFLLAAPLLAGGYLLYRYSHRTPEIPVNVPVPTPVSSRPVPPTQNAEASSSPQALAPGTTTSGMQDGTKSAALHEKTSSPRDESSMGAEPSASGGQPNLNAPSATGTAPTGVQGAAGGPTPASPTGPTTASQAGEGDLVLEVAATERAWVAVDADGKTIFQRTLDPNDIQTFTAKDSFEVWTGNAQGTVLTLNGSKQKSLGREGEIRRVRLTRNGLQQPAP
jgi:cytoskeleton protein RodZ